MDKKEILLETIRVEELNLATIETDFNNALKSENYYKCDKYKVEMNIQKKFIKTLQRLAYDMFR